MVRKFRIAFIQLAYRMLLIYWKLFNVKTKGVKVLLLKDDKIILVRHTYGGDVWKLPGGGLKKNEDPIEAAKREVHEELGIEVQEFEYVLGKYKRQGGDADETVTTVVASRWSFVRETLSPEILEFEYFETHNIPHNTAGATKRRINDFIQGKKELVGELW